MGVAIVRHYSEFEAMERRKQIGAILGIDPGPTESAYALVAPDYTVLMADKVETPLLYGVIDAQRPAHVVIEGVLIYQRSANHVRETAYAVGRIQRECERLGYPYTMLNRPTYVTALCGGKGNDSMLRQALALRFGGYGKGEPLHLLKGNTDKRSAYGLAVYWLDCRRFTGR